MAVSAAAAAAFAIPGTSHPDFVPSTAQRAQLLDAVQADALAVDRIQSQIDAAHAKLAEIQRKTDEKVAALAAERDVLRQGMHSAECIAAGVRRVPVELLATIFAIVEEPWTVAAVCVRWRREALALKSLWNRIKLRTVGGQASMDTIRLWLERSGSTGPLDIDIELVQKEEKAKVHKHPVLPDVTIVRTKCYGEQSSLHPHWTHINLYYLSQHMHRWRRFVFRFDLPLQSVPALMDLSGATPLLEEFEISRMPPPTEHTHDHMRHNERWTWLPSAGPADAPLLRKLALNLVPFMWTAPFLTASSALTELSFSKSTRGGNGEVAQADPVYKLLAHHAPTLRALRLEIAALQPAFLPIADIAMPALEELTIAGSATLLSVFANMSAPKLRELRIDVENNGVASLAATMNEFFIRSSLPSVRTVHVGTVRGKLLPEETFGSGGMELGDGELLAKLVDVRELGIGLHLEGARPLLAALAIDASILPHLTRLVVQGLRARPQRVLHSLHAPGGAGAADEAMLSLVVGLVRGRTLKTLELHAAQPVGAEREEWLRKRVEDLRIVLPPGVGAGGGMTSMLNGMLNKAAASYYPPPYMHSGHNLPMIAPPPIVMGYDDEDEGTDDDEFMDDYGF